MIPVCLVTGFLGSGKTTFLRHLIDTRADQRIIYLVNDFSPQDVDGELLRTHEDDVVSIPGGSIFCQCLVTEFIGRLQELVERHQAEAPFGGVVIEASGIADPLVVEQMLAETGLDEELELATVVAIVDPDSLPKLVQTLPNIRSQIRAADIVLLNKIDLFAADEVESAEQIVREIAPGASILHTVRCSADVAVFEGGGVRGLVGEYANGPDARYARFSVGLAEPLDLDRLRAGLEAVADELYRAKGVVTGDDGAHYVDMTPEQITIRPAEDGDRWHGLVMIARGDAHEGVADLIARMERGEMAP